MRFYVYDVHKLKIGFAIKVYFFFDFQKMVVKKLNLSQANRAKYVNLNHLEIFCACGLPLVLYIFFALK